MKRSELLKVLDEYLTEDRYSNFGIAEYVLKIVEQAGMLPPPKQVDIINDRLFYAYYPEGSISEKSEDANKIDIKELWEKE